MGKIYTDIVELIGHTPLLEAVNIEKEFELEAKILLKLEYFNPAGSAKDRIAAAMIADAKKSGILKEGATIIEPTSGNTGIGLASLAAAQGYQAIFVMPETMSIERQKLLKGYGAKVVLTEAAKGMAGSIEKAEELASKIPNSFIPGQFDNPVNANAHYATTGPEIWEDTEGNVDIFVAGVGTGGTLTGTGRYLKEKKAAVQIYAMEPASSPLLSKGYAGAHAIQGIGANFIPAVLDQNIYDGVITVENEDAFTYAKKKEKKQGILVGISSGAALAAAVELAKRSENKGKIIVALMPDTGERYLSTELFD